MTVEAQDAPDEDVIVSDRETVPASPDTESDPVPVGVRCPACESSNRVSATSCWSCEEPLAPRTSQAREAGAPSVADTLLAARDPRSRSYPPLSGPSTISGSARFPSGPPSIRVQSADFDSMEAPIADPLIGVVVAERYRILERLGRGGMGIVYRVEHTRIGKLLAMKVLTGELSHNREVVRRFKQEALTSSKLSSPNTVQVFDYGVSDNLTYLVMELVTGEDLGRALRASGPMGFDRLGRIVIQMCSSLSEAHLKGIVHRDVKPENVMLVRAKDGTDLAKVLDFGLAKLREGAELSDVTSQGAIVGTPYFMSPEQVRGESVDARSDLYSLGALMYRALTGHYPFNGPSPMSVFTKHLTETPPPPHERSPELGISQRVSAIVMKALAKDPDERFQRAEELQTAIVDEIRASGASSVETLLDSGAVRRLAHAVEQDRDVGAAAGVAPQVPAIATRDEVERYERKLRRQRYGAVIFFAMMLVAGAAVGARFLLAARVPVFTGAEIEPNDAASDATLVPLGRPATAFLGKRIDATHGDRDFFAFDVPAPSGGGPSVVGLHVGAIPNFATCTLLYAQGYTTPLAQYCVGRPGKDLTIDSLKLEPGRYLAAVMQDLDPYGAQASPFIHENVSDAYLFAVEPITPAKGTEVEPNDQVASSDVVGVGAQMRGVIGWARDEDVYCVPPGTPGAIRWRVTDAVRPGGTVLEVTPMRGTIEGAAVRVHTSLGGALSANDGVSPWQGDTVLVDDDSPRCLRVRLAVDPWKSGGRIVVPAGGSEAYGVQVEAP